MVFRFTTQNGSGLKIKIVIQTKILPVREGYLADLLLVDGDPLADVSILQRQERLVAIVQNGNFHKLDRDALSRRQGRTAE